MKIDTGVIDKNNFTDTLLKRAGFETKEEALQAASRQRDSYEYVGIQSYERCEQYNNLGIQLVKSGTVKLSLSSELKNDMLAFLEEYYEGKHTDEELEQQYISYCEQAGTSGKTRLLDVYENFVNMSRYAANNVCTRKGYEITAGYGKVEDHDAVYYHADYYYDFEKVKEIARSTSEKIAEEMHWGSLEFEERESSTIFNLDGAFNFNGKWAWNAENLINRCTMINSDLVPPEGFEFYYKERKYKDSEVGVMLLGTKNGYKEITVPFEAPKAGVEGYVQKFNAGELFRFTENDTDQYEEYNNFLKNFDIYTRYYYANEIEK